MKRPVSMIALLVLILATSACGPWPLEPRQEFVASQLAMIPAKRPPSAVFRDFRVDYDRRPEEWTEPAMKTLFAFEPEDDWQMHEFLSFACFLADHKEAKARDYLKTVAVRLEGKEPQPLLEILKAQGEPFEAYFDQNRVVSIDEHAETGSIVTIEPGSRS